jgi:hypothetical protein
MVPLKLVYIDDIRKIYVDNLTVATLHENIRTLFPELESIPFENLFVYYVDDEEDKIRIKLDIELDEALRHTKANSSVLKIFVHKMDIPSSPESGTTGIGVNELAPFLGMLNNVAPMLLNNPAAMQQMASMLPSMLPLLGSIFGTPQNPTNSSQSSTPSSPIVCPPSPDFGFSAAPSCTSVSTNTLIDAKDVATETFLYGVTQTTQTNQPNSSTQTTQTHQNASSGTQTAQSASATQTTQTNQNATCATQTAQESLASQTTQTQHNARVACETQTQSSDAQVTCETQTPREPQPIIDFYNSLAGTQFGDLLRQLYEIGFTDREKSVQALVKNGGKLQEAIEELLLDQLLE